MPRPTARPSWLGTRRAPILTQRNFLPEQTPPAEWLNWALGIPSDWLDYLDDTIQTTVSPQCIDLERTLEAQSFVQPRDLAIATATMQINSVAAATDANGVLLHVVAVGNSGVIMRYDAVRTEVTHPTAAASFVGTWNDVIYAGGQYVAVGATGTVQTSPDGITWTARSGFNTAYAFTSVAYGGGKYVVVGGDGGGTGNGGSYWSSDGATWTFANLPQTLVGRVVWAGGSIQQFVCFTGSNIRRTPASSIVWAATGQSMGATQVFDGCWHPTLGLVGFSRGVTIGQMLMYTSQNATSWTSFTSPAGWTTSSSIISCLPLANQIALFYAGSATTYATGVMLLPSLTAAPQPNLTPSTVLPIIYPGVVRRPRIAQSTWFGGFNRSATAARIACGMPIETLRGLAA